MRGRRHVHLLGRHVVDPDTCGTSLDSIGVTVLVDHSLVTGFFTGNRNIREHTTLRLEPLPLQNCG